MNDLIEQIEEIKNRIQFPEQVLGKGNNQPFNPTNSGQRKIMFNTHQEHRLPLMNPELALVQTGTEDKYGEYSSSLKVADQNYDVLAKVTAFSNKPNYHYYLIIRSIATGEIDFLERLPYKHITETYGYLYNNKYLDSLGTGDHLEPFDDLNTGINTTNSYIQKGAVIQRSTSFNDDISRIDGVNLITQYNSCDMALEDGFVISQPAADKLVSPLIKTVKFQINDNDIMLNLHGDDTRYKVIPDIGEKIERNMLCAIRREVKNESLFAQSLDRLKEILSSDEVYSVHGEIVDIKVYCNNPEALRNNIYNNQIYSYYNETMRMNQELVIILEDIMRKYNIDRKAFSDDLKVLYFNAKAISSGSQFFNDKVFSNIIMEVAVLEKNEIQEGDKITDRYGCKGIVSKILPEEAMPITENGERVEVIINKSTCVNRLNPGQLFEVEINHAANELTHYMSSDAFDDGMKLDMYLEFISIFSPDQAIYIENLTSNMTDYELKYFIETIIDEGIILSMSPMRDPISLDITAKIYEKFPYIKKNRVLSPIRRSNGTLSYTPSRNTVMIGKKYYYRLKQYAEEKFSATSLSPTNIVNENSKSKASKLYKSAIRIMCIRYGEMEHGNLLHAGYDTVILMKMIYADAPKARREAETLLTGDPFNIDVKLGHDATSRSAEKFNVYFKTLGLKMNIVKRKIKRRPPALLEAAWFVPGMNGEIPTYKARPNQAGFVLDRNHAKPTKNLISEELDIREKSPALLIPARFIEREERDE